MPRGAQPRTWTAAHNYLKVAACREVLTPSQVACFNSVLSVGLDTRRLNLHGQAGVGKTFLAWALAREVDVRYMPDPKVAPQKARILVVDEAPTDRLLSRAICVAALDYSDCVVLLTRTPIEDHIAHLQLSLSEEDLAAACHLIAEARGAAPVEGRRSAGVLWDYLGMRA